MKYRRKYTLFTLKNRKGKPVWYFRIYLPDGTRRSKTTGCNSREKAMRYVEELLEDETMLRKVFESDLVVAIDSEYNGSGEPVRRFMLSQAPNSTEPHTEPD